MCKAVELRAKRVARNLGAEYWTVSAKTGKLYVYKKKFLHTKFFILVLLDNILTI